MLSNNDGCAIARTAEAKALGIRMGDPWFKISDTCRREGVRVFSSNYALYGDMSARANAIYRGFSPRWRSTPSTRASSTCPTSPRTSASSSPATCARRCGLDRAADLRRHRPDQDLAKLANHVAKKNPELGGVCDLTDDDARRRWMAAVALEEVWGIGPASQAKLRRWAAAPSPTCATSTRGSRANGMTVVGSASSTSSAARPASTSRAVAPTRKGCAVTRSFSRRVEDLATMEQAVATHATRLGEKLRREALGTDHVTVFFHTSEHDRRRPQRSGSTTVTLPEATNDTLVARQGGDVGCARVWRRDTATARPGSSPSTWCRSTRVSAPSQASAGSIARGRPRSWWRSTPAPSGMAEER